MKSLKALPLRQPLCHTAPVRPRLATSRLLVRKVAAIEEQQTAYEPSAEDVAAVAPAEAEVDEVEAEIDELDASQEELIKWMLFLDKDAQEDDLDEMVDYEEYADDEYEQLFEDVEDTMVREDYDFKVGDKVMGTVYEVDENGAYVEIGAKTAGFVPLIECSLAKLKTPLEVLRAGMKREFVVVEEEDDHGEITLSLAALEASVFWQRIRQLQQEDITVHASVISVNRGGVMVQYGHVEGFVPYSQFSQKLTVETAEALIGSEIPLRFNEVDEERERIVFSNRRAGPDGAEIQGFKVGDVVLGVVQSVKPYGAFIDIGGVTGLLHVSQISHERIMNVDKYLSEGDKLKVMILSQDKDRGRVTLSTKKLEPEPGDFLRDPAKVFEKAEEMAATFRERVAVAEAAARMEEQPAAADQFAASA